MARYGPKPALTVVQDRFVRMEANALSTPEIIEKLWGITTDDTHYHSYECKLSRWRKLPQYVEVWMDEVRKNDFADCELAWTSFNKAVRKFSFRWQGMLQGDMKNKERRIHPTQKPVALYKWILANYANEGDLILDTHVGSASSLIACEDMGLKYVGFEIDPTFYKESKERLDNHAAQLSIVNMMNDWRLP